MIVPNLLPPFLPSDGTPPGLGPAGPTFLNVFVGTAVEQYVDNGTTTLSMSIGANDTSLATTSLGTPPFLFPARGSFRIVAEQEIILVGNADGLNWGSLQRGADGTYAAPHAAGVTLKSVFSKASFLAGTLWGRSAISVAAGAIVAVQANAFYSGDGTGNRISYYLPGAFIPGYGQGPVGGGPAVGGTTVIFQHGAPSSNPQNNVPGAPAVLIPAAADCIADPQQPGVFSAAGASVWLPFGAVLGLKYDGVNRWVPLLHV